MTGSRGVIFQRGQNRFQAPHLLMLVLRFNRSYVCIRDEVIEKVNDIGGCSFCF